MPDERDPQNAAPSADGDTSHDTSAATATAVATEDPPETEAKDETSTASAGSTGDDGGGEQIDEGTGGGEEAARETAAAPEASAETSTETAASSTKEEESEPVQAAAEQEDAAVEAAVAEPAKEVEGEPVQSATEQEDAATEAASESKTGAAEVVAEAAPAAEATAAAEPEAQTTGEPEVEAEAKTEVKAEAKAESELEAEAKTESAPEAKGESKAAAGKAEAKKQAKAEEKEPAIDDPALLALREAKEKGTTVTGKVIGWNRGGFHVVIDEITAFCPASEMELGRPRSPDTYMDRELDFKVAKFQRRGRRVVLSRADLLKSKRDEILAGLSPGTVVQGTVTSLPDFGAFVDLGGVEGLVHVSEISRSRVSQPKDVLQLGQEVEVKVLKVEKGGDRISLSMRELEPDPWKGVAQRYPRGSKFSGKILRHAEFGMFVELEPDVEGLVHVSQLAPGSDLKNEALQPGQSIEGWVREVDPKRQRISLSLREVPDEDPWKDVAKRLPEGEMVEGTVESIAPFGVFINLSPGLTGLLPNSQTGLPRGTNAARSFRPGQKVSVQVLSVDSRRKRISLGKEGSRVEATKADLQDFRKQQREAEKKSPSAMEAAFARLGLGGENSAEK